MLSEMKKFFQELKKFEITYRFENDDISINQNINLIFIKLASINNINTRHFRKINNKSIIEFMSTFNEKKEMSIIEFFNSINYDSLLSYKLIYKYMIDNQLKLIIWKKRKKNKSLTIKITKNDLDMLNIYEQKLSLELDHL